jgi:hypothetical protein
MSDGLWYDENPTPAQLAAELEQARQQRDSMTAEQRAELAQFMLEGLAPKQQQPAAPPVTRTGARSTANSDSGVETSPANDDVPRYFREAPSSAEVLEGFKSGKHYPGDPEAAKAFFTGRLAEAVREHDA